MNITMTDGATGLPLLCVVCHAPATHCVDFAAMAMRGASNMQPYCAEHGLQYPVVVTQAKEKTMTGMTEEQLAQIRERAMQATDGPWVVTEEPSPDHVMGWRIHIADTPPSYWGHRTGLIAGNYDQEQGGICSTAEDAAFIAHARQDIPMLLAEIERLRGEGK